MKLYNTFYYTVNLVFVSLFKHLFLHFSKYFWKYSLPSIMDLGYYNFKIIFLLFYITSLQIYEDIPESKYALNSALQDCSLRRPGRHKVGVLDGVERKTESHSLRPHPPPSTSLTSGPSAIRSVKTVRKRATQYFSNILPKHFFFYLAFFNLISIAT